MARRPSWPRRPTRRSDHARPSARWEGVVGGEASRDFVERVRAGLTEFLAARGVYRTKQILPVWHMDRIRRRIAVFAHAGTNGVLLCHLLGLDPVPWEWDRFVTGHASITRLTSIELGDGHTFSLTKLSDVEHLDHRRPHRHGGLAPAAAHALDAVDERALQVVGLARDLEVREPRADLVEHHRDLAPGQVGAEAEVRTAGAEADVLRLQRAA